MTETVTHQQENLQPQIVAFDMSKISDALETLATERQQTNDILQSFVNLDLDVKMQADKTGENLKVTQEILTRIDKRLSILDLQEAKMKVFMRRVDGVLGELERVLKQL